MMPVGHPAAAPVAAAGIPPGGAPAVAPPGPGYVALPTHFGGAIFHHDIIQCYPKSCSSSCIVKQTN